MDHSKDASCLPGGFRFIRWPFASLSLPQRATRFSTGRFVAIGMSGLRSAWSLVIGSAQKSCLSALRDITWVGSPTTGHDHPGKSHRLCVGDAMSRITTDARRGSVTLDQVDYVCKGVNSSVRSGDMKRSKTGARIKSDDFRLI
jgi:hypothetical protein